MTSARRNISFLSLCLFVVSCYATTDSTPLQDGGCLSAKLTVDLQGVSSSCTTGLPDASIICNETKTELDGLRELVQTLLINVDETQQRVKEMKKIVQTIANNTKCGVECPSPFTKVGEECFYRNDESELMNWDEARKRCIALGGDLATPANVPLLREYLREIGMAIGVWIGGHDRENPGFWRYLTGQEIKSSDWSTTDGVQQPDYLGVEQCLELRRYFTPPVNNYICDKDQGFVCQYGAPGCISGIGCGGGIASNL